MKTSLNWVTIGVIVLAALFLKTSGINALEVPPVPVSITPSVMQYKVIDLSQIGVTLGQSPVSTLEAGLNSLGAEGWKVVTTTGSLIILNR